MSAPVSFLTRAELDAARAEAAANGVAWVTLDGSATGPAIALATSPRGWLVVNTKTGRGG